MRQSSLSLKNCFKLSKQTRPPLSLQNPKYGNLIHFLEKFNKDWVKRLNERITDKNKDALTSIVNNKNLIAHGESSNITFLSVRQHYEDSKIIIEQLDSIILEENI